MCTAVVFGADEQVSSGSGGGNEEDRATRIALEQPLGRYLVIAVGLAIVGAGVFNVYRALTGDFRKELKEGQMGSNERRWYTWLGVVGHLARGVIFGLAGAFLIRAAWEYKPKEAVGLDGCAREARPGAVRPGVARPHRRGPARVRPLLPRAGALPPGLSPVI